MTAPAVRLLAIRRRGGHTERIEVSGRAVSDPWRRWALEQERCTRCTAAWLDRPQCEGSCTTGLLAPSTLALETEMAPCPGSRE